VLAYFHFSAPAGGNIYGVELAKALQSRYGFLEGPKTVQEYNLATGVTFLHGYFDRRVVIDKCQVFQNGLIVESKSSVNECDAFIDDMVEWATKDENIAITPWENAARGYCSHLEVICEASLSGAFKRYQEVIDMLSEMLSGYGHSALIYEPVSISLHTDITEVPYPKPNAFTFTRRVQQPYSSNIYFTEAPLRTDDHLKFLEAFEKILA
jgi:hypothetical protein